MAELDLSELKEKFAALLASVKASLGDRRLTYAEFAEAVTLSKVAIAEAIEVADQLRVPGEERKVLVLEFWDKLYATVIAPIDIPFVPNIVVEPAVDRIVGELWHRIGEGVIEGDLRILRRRQAVLAAAVGPVSGAMPTP